MNKRPLKPGPVNCFVGVSDKKIDELAFRYGLKPDLDLHCFANALMLAFEIHNRMVVPMTDEDIEEIEVRDALQMASDVFRAYQKHHENKGDDEKAERNLFYAEKMEVAIKSLNRKAKGRGDGE